VDEVNSFSCSCSLGFHGEKCQHEFDECSSDPCLNNATCTDGVNRWNAATNNVVVQFSKVYPRDKIHEGNFPPIPKVASKFFKLIKLLMCKPKKNISVQINETAMRNLSYFSF